MENNRLYDTKAKIAYKRLSPAFAWTCLALERRENLRRVVHIERKVIPMIHGQAPYELQLPPALQRPPHLPPNSRYYIIHYKNANQESVDAKEES